LFTEGEIQTAVEKKALLDAINRAKLCGAQEDKAPVLLNVSGQNINITYKNQTADYTEDISTQIDVGDGLKIAFDPTLVMECVKAFECENISISFTSRKHPAIIHAEDSDMTALVLPVNFKE
jgi:DNA polymerase III sliding clamp (beta) subunit (PCNA family)